jgi:putative membrane protein
LNKKGENFLETNRFLSVHYFLRAAILLGFAMFIVHLAKTDSLVYYIAPRMQGYVKYSSVVLYIIAIYQVYSGINSLWGKRAACDCEHPPSKSPFNNTIVYSMFVFPLLLGFALPNTAMSSAMADKKGMNLNVTASINNPASQVKVTNATLPNPTNAAVSVQPTTTPSPISAPQENTSQTTNHPAPSDEELKKMFAPPDQYSDDFSKMGMILYKKDKITVQPEIFMEILSTIDMFKDNFYGKQIELSGFVYREDDLKANQLVVGRFAVSCCSADASPYGVLTEFPNANNFAKDTWVKITGTIEKGNYHDNEIFKVHATKIEKIQAPKSSYIYPNMDPLSVLTK